MTPLASIIHEEAELVSELVSLLEREQALLSSGKPEQLAEITLKKNVLVEQIDQKDKARIQLIQQPELAGDRDGMTRWFTTRPQEKEAATLWQKTISAMRSAKEMHDQNGRLINLLLAQTKDALDILTQHQQQHALYGSDGQTANKRSSRIVDSA